MAEKSKRQDSLFVSAPLPPSSNNIYRSGDFGKRYLTKEAREYKKSIGKTINATAGPKAWPAPPFSLYLHLRLPDRRRRDASNAVKLLEDAIFSHLEYDDSLVYDLHVFKYLDIDNPGVAVELRHTDRVLEASS